MASAEPLRDSRSTLPPGAPAAAVEASGPVALHVRLGTAALVLLPAALTVYLSFHAGGFFPATPALVALLLGQVLLVRTLTAEHPVAGSTRALAVATTALALYAAWGLASALWSDALGRALVEFDRVLMYLLVLLLFGSMRWTAAQARWMVRAFAAGLVVVCAAALISRVLPDVLHTSPDFAKDRLSYPLTYWNALGFLAALAVLLCASLTSDEREAPVIRVLAAAALPVAATTLYFTLSRGGIAACLLGLVVLVAVTRPRGLLTGALAVAGPMAVALVSAYHADLLVSSDPTAAAAVVQGHHVALVVGLAALAAGAIRLLLCPLDTRLARATLPAPSRRAGAGLAAGAVAVLVVAGIAAGLPGTVAQGYRDFVGHDAVGEGENVRGRLTDPGNAGRVSHWRVALRAMEDAPVTGSGLGTFEIEWARRRPETGSVVNAHSLYLETLGELGLVGGLLLGVALATMLLAFARRARGPDRRLYGTLLAAAVAWAFHAGVDWDWQMPATTLWLFAFGGVVLSARAAGEPVRFGDRWRLPAAAGWLALLVTPLLVLTSQSRVHAAVDHFGAGDCPAATKDALSSIRWLNVRAEPYQILAYCDLRQGRTAEAVRAMREAVRLDPHSWETSYGLALALASAGSTPTRELRRAVRQNPREVLIRDSLPGLESSSPARRRLAVRVPRLAVVTSGRLSIGAG
jgi:hypothetical protein